MKLSISALCIFYLSGSLVAMQALPSDHWLSHAIKIAQQVKAHSVHQFLTDLVQAEVSELHNEPLLDHVLAQARREKREQVAQFLLMFVVQYRNQDSGQLLIDCIRAGHADEVSVLLNAGESANGRDGSDGVPLTEAIHAGHSEVVQRLLAHWARVHSQHVLDAAVRGNLAILRMLLANGDRRRLLDHALKRVVAVQKWAAGKLLVAHGACAREVAFRKAKSMQQYNDILQNLGQADYPDVDCCSEQE